MNKDDTPQPPSAQPEPAPTPVVNPPAGTPEPQPAVTPNSAADKKAQADRNWRIALVVIAVMAVLFAVSFVFNGSAPPGCLHSDSWRGICVSRKDGFHILWRSKNSDNSLGQYVNPLLF